MIQAKTSISKRAIDWLDGDQRAGGLAPNHQGHETVDVARGTVEISDTDARETTIMSEDVMSRDDFASLVRESVLRAVHGGRVQSPPAPSDADDTLIIGAGARAVVEQAVVATIKELLGRHALLSGPLKELAARLDAAQADANELRAMLREVDATLAQSQTQAAKASAPVVAPPTQKPSAPVAAVPAPARPNKPAAPSASAKLLPAVVAPTNTSMTIRSSYPGQKKCARCKAGLWDANRSQRNPAYCTTCLAPVAETVVSLRSTDEIVVEAVSAKASKPVEAVSAKVDKPAEQAVKLPADHLEPVWVNGDKIVFNKQSQPGFVRFFREFVVDLKKKPVSGHDAYTKAQSYGFTGIRTTFIANIENKLGKLDKVDGVWSLPGWTGTAS